MPIHGVKSRTSTTFHNLYSIAGLVCERGSLPRASTGLGNEHFAYWTALFSLLVSVRGIAQGCSWAESSAIILLHLEGFMSNANYSAAMFLSMCLMYVYIYIYVLLYTLFVYLFSDTF